MTTLLLRMMELLQWAKMIIIHEYFPEYGDIVRKRAWLKESDEVLDELKQRMGM